MSRPSKLKSMHDVRTLRSIPARAIPTNEGATYLQLYRLATEKLRLEREAELWLWKKERLEARLAEIEQQMAQLRRTHPSIAVESHVSSPKRSWREVTLEY